jgi:hypothetical protein
MPIMGGSKDISRVGFFKYAYGFEKVYISEK